MTAQISTQQIIEAAARALNEQHNLLFPGSWFSLEDAKIIAGGSIIAALRKAAELEYEKRPKDKDIDACATLDMLADQLEGGR